MSKFDSWGVKVRSFPNYNYRAIWNDLETLRIGKGVAKELPPDCAEFYDVSLGTKCNLECPFCYTDAKRGGRFYDDIVTKAQLFFGAMDDNQKPFQIAIGSEGEPTIHPDFPEFIKAIYDMGIVPNYTTNGITLGANEVSPILLAYTEQYCGGVAVSANTWNHEIDEKWRKAVKRLSQLDIKINLHYIINNIASVLEFKEIYKEFESVIHNFVLLPMMPSGRSVQKYTEDAFQMLIDEDCFDFKKIAFGAHFYNLLNKNQDKIKCWLYPPESLSKNLILDDTIKITASSFHKEPLMEIPYKIWVEVGDKKYFIYAHEKELIEEYYKCLNSFEHFKQYLNYG